MYTLTEEGLRYLRDGLPEVRLASILDKPMKIEDARRGVEDFNIALQWAKKRGWIRIDQGLIVPVKKPETPREQLVLESISKTGRGDENTVKILLRRKLVKREREDVFKRAERLSGKEITNLTPELIMTGMWRNVKLKPYNITALGTKTYPGKRQPYNRFLSQVRKKLVELGFKEMIGPMIETEFWNFDALFQAQDHPSRDWTQTYTLKNPKTGSLPDKKIVERVKASHENGWKTSSRGWGYKWDPKKAARLMPRAHTTACSARTLAKKPEIPGKYFIVSRNFRPDVIDSTHGVEFNHCEGIVIDPSINFKNLLGLLKSFAIEFAEAEAVRFFPDYYPFTEPSVQLSAKHPEMGWIELAGAGIFRPELTEPLGVKEPVIAWGLGIDRLAMFKLDIKDIRELFSQNLGWLRRQRVI